MKSIFSSKTPIYFNEDHQVLSEKINDIHPSAVYILADENTSKVCVPFLQEVFDFKQIFIIPSGESSKNLEQCEAVWSALIREGAERKSLLLNVGGGMITDLGGFVASCFQRGIRFIHVPTSLLGMTDAAIGGKVGIDFQQFKNYLGLLNEAEFIWIQTSFLQTLPHEEIVNGLAEIVKHAVIGSIELWDQLAQITSHDETDWTALLPLSIQVKLKTVEADPLETGLRKTLNFGHTIGHALESYFLGTSDELSHGQAITYGMLVESKMAEMNGLLPVSEFERIENLIEKLLKPAPMAIPGKDELLKWLERDKKNAYNQLSFSLPDRIGHSLWGVYGLDPGPALAWLKNKFKANLFV